MLLLIPSAGKWADVVVLLQEVVPFQGMACSLLQGQMKWVACLFGYSLPCSVAHSLSHLLAQPDDYSSSQ